MNRPKADSVSMTRDGGTTSGRGAADQRRLATIAAFFWFELVGGLAVVWTILVSPFTCFEGACPEGAADLIGDGTLIIWAVILAGVATIGVVTWFATGDRAWPRAVAYVVIGSFASVLIVIAALMDVLFALLWFIWIGIPAVLLLGTWVPVLANAFLRRRSARYS
jgi:hypothetical protein